MSGKNENWSNCAAFYHCPPAEYGGTELFIAHLAQGLKELGVKVVVYTNAESTVDVEKRWLFDKAQWPLRKEDGKLIFGCYCLRQRPDMIGLKFSVRLSRVYGRRQLPLFYRP